MPTTQLPLMKGTGKDFGSADYLDLLPVNMLATPKEVLNASGYMRSFPGIMKRNEVDGVSRGAQYNTSQNAVYRVLGGVLYKGEINAGQVAGTGRVSMTFSSTSQVVVVDGIMNLYRYNGERKALENWPEKVITTPESETVVKSWVSTSGEADENTFDVTTATAVGSFVITVTPALSGGTEGEIITVSETQWNLTLSQQESDDKPYITDLVVSGNAAEGETVKIAYTLNIPEGSTETNATAIEVVQHIPEVATEYAQYQIGSVRDACRLRGRYIWVKDGTDTFGVTDLTDESHPDQYRPFYQAESQPDGIQGCGVWRDFVVMFGTSTIEFFSLTGSTDTTAAIYVAQPSLMVSKGIAGTYCKSPFAGSYAFISHPASGAPSVYVINSGQLTSIASSSIEKILRSYSIDELSKGVMEAVRFDSHEMLLIHLPRHVLCYDAAASQNGPQWTLLKSGLEDDPYRAIDFMYEGNQLGVGDKLEPQTGVLSFDLSSHYSEQTEHILYTPMFKADNARVFDFELEAATGVTQEAEKLFISATVDGINYGREQILSSDAPFIYDKRVLWRRIGRIRKNIGFKMRIVTTSPVTLSGCSVRVE